MKLLAVFLFLFLVLSLAFASEPAPSFPQSSNRWLDGKPLGWGDLKGKVVLLNVWTFACWNSYRSLPWVVSLQQKFPEMQIVGVHSPEFDYEKNRSQMKQTMSNYKVNYPQLLDDNHEYWDRLQNEYWPSFYVVDKHGRIRGRFAGETHAGDNQAKEIEKLLQQLSMEN